MSSFNVQIGPEAAARLGGRFDLDQVDALLGAAGGPKWLVLAGLDRLLAPALAARKRPVHLIGASIGSWRFACYAQPDPVAAVEAFEHHYIEQRYSPAPTLAEVDVGARAVVDAFMGPTGAEDALRHPTIRLGVLAARSRGLTRFEHRVALGAGLTLTAGANLVARAGAGVQFRQTLLHDPRVGPPVAPRRGLPVDQVPLSAASLPAALMASSAIPGLMSGVDDLPGAPRGRYRDGGLVDYHLDLPLKDEGGIILHVHFWPRVHPGWFDKIVPWRRPRHLDRAVVITPSPSFIASLPHGRIPSRKDFSDLGHEGRVKAWWATVEASKRFGEEVMSALTTGRLLA